MIPFPSRLIVSLALIYLLSIVGGAAVLAAQDDPPDRPPAEPETIPEDRVLKDLDIKVWGPWKQTAERDYLFEGKVTITWRESRIQADRMSLTQGRYIEAEGNILIVWEGNRISGTRLTYDLEEERGFIENAINPFLTGRLRSPAPP
jgi:lipopolysaccharide assembly outer membrane protein LptD (OstA)